MDIYEFVIQAVEKSLIENALARTGGNQSAAARILGMNRNTLHAKTVKLGIDSHTRSYQPAPAPLEGKGGILSFLETLGQRPADVSTRARGRAP